MKMKTRWNISKHIIFSIIIALLVFLADFILPLMMSNASIAIIGGADGPTSIYTTIDIAYFKLVRLFLNKYTAICIILMLLYKPFEYLINRGLVKRRE
ncbi:MAG: hypothetical protein CVU84_08120 [Firmicutes bacterium HGW-Firmicutes-1]|jgi:Na+-transporting methylmalonyl-CoA/oxaloacetate decarboxylase beta subunit|nr:MAG: hypothetical protein CVU84_08120 [Firmicutes bacterium HGW-Firmicutes-1]